jgi:hypothetical protein
MYSTVFRGAGIVVCTSALLAVHALILEAAGSAPFAVETLDIFRISVFHFPLESLDETLTMDETKGANLTLSVRCSARHSTVHEAQLRLLVYKKNCLVGLWLRALLLALSKPSINLHLPGCK